MGKLFFVSLFTLGALFSIVFGIALAALVYFNIVGVWFAIGFAIIFNFIMWLFGPRFTDIINRWFYKVKFLSKEEVFEKYPEVAKIIDQVSSEYKFKFPKIGIIPDKNPTAFTYGSARFNSRIVLTDGIFHFLTPQEATAVVAHELGHIVNRDFIVMMIGSTFVQIIYLIYAWLIEDDSIATKFLAPVVYGLYIVGIFLLYFLSRTREYLADDFSAKITEPNDLSNALIKIAYGIVIEEDSQSTSTLLQSTRHLGIIDVKNAKHYGIASYVSQKDPNVISEVMVFDKVNPWAKFIELNSTHPLTGKRIANLSNLSKDRGKHFAYDVDAAITRMKINKTELYAGFLTGIFIVFLPLILMIFASIFLPYYFIPAAIAIGLFVQIPYRFSIKAPVETTILDEMRNPYASPIKGKQVLLSGEVVGRGVPGFVIGEDMMYKDKTGLVFLDYNSLFGFIGNIFFGLKKINKLFEKPSIAAGWFYRGMGSMISLKYLKTDAETVKSHPVFWAICFPIFLIFVSIGLYYLFSYIVV